MAATVKDGALQFTSNIDDSELTADARRIAANLTHIAETAQKTTEAITESHMKEVQASQESIQASNELRAALDQITNANKDAFNAGEITAYGQQIADAAQTIQQMIEATGNNFGAEKLQALDDQLKKVSTDGEILQTIFEFLRQNVADLKLTPADTDTFLSKIQELSGVLQTLKEESQDLGPIVASTFKDDSGFLQEHYNSIRDLEAELDKLIQREAMLKRAIDNTNDPSALESYQAGLRKTSTQIEGIAQRLDELNDQKLSTTLESAQKNGANLLTQLREMRYAIADAMEQFGSGSPEVTKLIQQAAELENRLRNADRQVALFGSNTAGLDALKQGFNGLFGGITAMISAVGLLSGDNNALQDTMVKLFAVMQVVNGSEQLFAVLNKNSAASAYLKGIALKFSTKSTADNTIATEANTVAKAQNTAANEANAASLATQAEASGAATGATTALTGAASALAIPLGVVALVIAEIVGIYEIFQQKAKDAALAQELLNTSIKNSQNFTESIVSGIKQTGDRVAAQMAANGATQEEINQETLSNLQDQQTQYYNEANKAADNFANFQSQLSKKYGSTQQNGQTIFTKSLSKEDAQNYKDAYDLYVSAQKKSTDAQQAYELKRLQNEKETNLQTLQDYSASLATRISELKQSGNEEQALEVQKQKNLSDARAAAWGKDAAIQNQIFAQAAEQNAQIDIQLKDLQISNAEEVQKAKLALAKEGSLDEYSARIQLIDLAAQKEINDAKGNQDKINAIKAQAEKDKNTVTDQANAAEITREKDAAEAAVNARLSSVQKGSKHELDLQLQLIDQKEKYDLANVQFTIHNEEARQTAITNIQTKALQDREAAEKKYYDNLYNLQVQAARRHASEASLPFQAEQNNPLATDYQKDQAAVNETLIRQNALQKELEIRVTEYTSAVARGATNTEEYRKKIDDVNSALQVLNFLLGNQTNQLKYDKIKQVSDSLQFASQAFATLASNIQAANPGLSDFVQGFSNLAASANNIYQAFQNVDKETGKVKDGFLAAQVAIDGTVSLISMVISASAKRHEAEQEFNASLISQQDEYNKALNQSILLNYQLKDNIFVTDLQEQITDGVNALSDATDKYQDALKNLAGAQVIAGKRKAVDWSNVLSGAGAGAAVGAAVGSVVPVVGTVIGAAVGAVGGAIAGLFSKKSKDVLKPILAEYPELLDKTKTGVDQFNDALAQSLIDSKLVKGQSEETLETLIQWKQAVEAANKQIEDAVSTLAGSLGDNLRDSLVSAFEDGTDAGQAFAKSVGDSLESVLKQLLFNAVFGDALKDLQDKLTNTLENGGDVTDVYTKFFQTYSGLSQQFDASLEQLKQQAQANGLDIFQSQTTSGQNTLEGAIKAGITEDTATILAGTFNAIRLEEIAQTDLQKAMSGSMTKQIDIMMQHLSYAIKIETNTGKTAANTAALANIDKSLKSIDSKMSDSTATKRANGLG